MKHQPIAIFDSGMGGITVLCTAQAQLPHESFIYYADTAHVPYGTKEKVEVERYVVDAADFLFSKNIKALVIACNTATSIAVAVVREKYPDRIVIGMEPAVKPAIEIHAHKEKRVLVCATPLTLREKKFNDLVTRVDVAHIVDSLALPELVVYAERGEFSQTVIDAYLRNEFTAVDLTKYETIVLGCTHYPLFYPHFSRVLPQDIRIIDGNFGTVRHLYNVLRSRDLLHDRGESTVTFMSSGKTNEDKAVFSSLFRYYTAVLADNNR